MEILPLFQGYTTGKFRVINRAKKGVIGRAKNRVVGQTSGEQPSGYKLEPFTKRLGNH